MHRSWDTVCFVFLGRCVCGVTLNQKLSLWSKERINFSAFNSVEKGVVDKFDFETVSG